MGFFDSFRGVFTKNPAKTEVKTAIEARNSIENPSMNLEDISTWSELFGYADSGKVQVNSETALRFSAVYACVSVISQTIASLPKTVWTKDGQGKKVANSHALQRMFSTQPNDLQTWFDFMETLVASALLRGNGYAYIQRDPSTYKPVKLHLLTEGECSPVYVNYGLYKELYYVVGGQILSTNDILHIKCLGSNGIIGKSPIQLAEDGISTGLMQTSFVEKVFSRGGTMTGLLTHPGKLQEQARERLKNRIQSEYHGMVNAGKTMVLEEGMKYERTSITPQDAQLLESRKYQVEDIARIYRVPLHKIAMLDRSTNNNIERQAIDFAQDTILPWVERIEQELDKKCLAENEKGTRYTELDIDYLLRADSVSRAAMTNSLFNTGAISPNEIRVKEGYNPKETDGMDDTYMPVNMQKVAMVGQQPQQTTQTQQSDGGKQAA